MGLRRMLAVAAGTPLRYALVHKFISAKSSCGTASLGMTVDECAGCYCRCEYATVGGRVRKDYAGASNLLDTQVELAPGRHRFTVLAINTAGQQWGAGV